MLHFPCQLLVLKRQLDYHLDGVLFEDCMRFNVVVQKLAVNFDEALI